MARLRQVKSPKVRRVSRCSASSLALMNLIPREESAIFGKHDRDEQAASRVTGKRAVEGMLELGKGAGDGHGPTTLPLHL